MKYCLLILNLCIVGENYCQNNLNHNYNSYLSIRPVNYLLLSPNFQYGIRIKSSDTSNKGHILELSLTYPYGKAFSNYLYDLYNTRKYRLSGIQSEIHYRFVSKKNRFWGPSFEYNYNDAYLEYMGNMGSINQFNEKYVLLRLGFQNGRYYKKKDSKSVNVLFWGAALRYVIDFSDPNKVSKFGHRDMYHYGVKAYLNWQFGYVLNRKK